MDFTINLNAPTHSINNFWNHIHFHPTDAIEDEWGQKILNNIANDNVAKRIRIYTMFEDIVSLDENGNLTFDYTENDVRIDFLLSKGFTLLIDFLFMPSVIAKDKNAVSILKRYKDKKVFFSVPKDYKLWEEVCYNYTKHVVDKYGIEEVSKWYFHCWNEPDHIFWMNNTPVMEDCPEKAEEYLKLYDYFAEGVSRVSDKIKIGGPSSGGNMKFIETFAKHIAEGNNLATGKKGIKFDFFSMHTYEKYSRTNPSVFAKIEATHRYNDLFKKYGFENKEILIDEWGVTVDGHKTIADIDYLEFRETTYFSAFFAKLIKEYSKEITKGLPVTHLMICLSGQHDSFTNFDGHRSFFSRDGIEKPIYNAYSMCSNLGNSYYDTEDNGNVSNFVTKNDDGYSVLLYNLCDDLYDVANEESVELNLEGIDSGKYKIEKFIIDDTHSFGYGEYKRLGCDTEMTDEEFQKVKIAAKLYKEEKTEDISNKYSDKIYLTDKASVLIKLTKI